VANHTYLRVHYIDELWLLYSNKVSNRYQLIHIGKLPSSLLEVKLKRKSLKLALFPMSQQGALLWSQKEAQLHRILGEKDFS